MLPEGTGYRVKTRFARFFNLPELISVFKEAADVRTADMLHLPVPEAEYVNVVLKPSEIQQDMVSSFADRAEAVRAGSVDPRTDNMLKITNDGRKCALDQRLLNDLLPDEPDSKVNHCVENAFSIWQETSDIRATQLIFCDLSTPKGDGSFNVYDDVRDKLVAKGVPREEVAFIHEATTETKKAEARDEIDKFPDQSIGLSEMHEYGYRQDDMYPLTQEKALEMHRLGFKVYCLQPDGTAGTFSSREMIEEHTGIFGIRKADWDYEMEHLDDEYTEDTVYLHPPMSVLEKDEALRLFDAGETIYLIATNPIPVAATIRSGIFSLCDQIIIGGLQFLSGIEAVLLNIGDGFCHLLEIGDFHLLRIGSALLRLHIILKINNQPQICLDEKNFGVLRDNPTERFENVSVVSRFK